MFTQYNDLFYNNTADIVSSDTKISVQSADGTFGNADYMIETNIADTGKPNYQQISMNYSNEKTPRCKIQKDCTINHYYYPNTQTEYTTDSDGNVSCKCTHDEKMVMNTNNKPHSHCNVTNDVPTVQDFLYNTVHGKSATDKAQRTPIQQMNLGFTSSYQTSASTSNSNIPMTLYEKQQKEYSEAIDDIVEIATDYYISLLENKEKGEKLQKIFGLNDGASAYKHDSSQLYENNYLKIVNLSVASVVILGYIFGLTMMKPK
jgi:hypothetical protein